MGHRRFCSAALLTFLFVGASGGVAAAAEPFGRPNIVFVLTDDLSSNLVTHRFMPNLWALEQQGTTFSNYFVTDSLCCPSRASIFTGRLPHDDGVLDNSGPDGGYTSFNAHDDENSTVATDLQGAGYRTAMMGKYLNKYQTSDPPPPGWNQWDVANWGYPEFNYDLNENGRDVKYGGPHEKGKDNYLTDVISKLGNQFINQTIDADPSQPFFLELGTFAPHDPYTPAPKYSHLYPDLVYPATPAFNAVNIDPPKWLGTRPPLSTSHLEQINNDFRKRAEDVKSVDDMIGKLVATLRNDGELSNTEFVFSSDNGLHMGEHRLAPGKLTAFDTDIQVPLIVVGPKVPAGATVTSFAENIDLRSTFDAFAGITPSEPVDGRSLVPLLEAPTAAPPPEWPKGVLVEHHGPDFTKSDPDKPPPYSGNPPTYVALRFSHALYVQYADGEHEYYDLTTDPYELNNVYATLTPARATVLTAEVGSLEQCHDSPACSEVEPPGQQPGAH